MCQAISRSLRLCPGRRSGLQRSSRRQPVPDAQATFETLGERGVDIADEPTERPDGIDFDIRDPFGNAIGIGQMFNPNGA